MAEEESLAPISQRITRGSGRIAATSQKYLLWHRMEIALHSRHATTQKLNLRGCPRPAGERLQANSRPTPSSSRREILRHAQWHVHMCCSKKRPQAVATQAVVRPPCGSRICLVGGGGARFVRRVVGSAPASKSVLTKAPCSWSAKRAAHYRCDRDTQLVTMTNTSVRAPRISSCLCNSGAAG